MRDINNTRHHLVFASDWEALSQPNELSRSRQWKYDSSRQGLRLQSEIFTFSPDYELILISLASGRTLPTQGKRLVCIAQDENEQATLYFRIFDDQGNQVVNILETELGEAKSNELETLKALIQNYWDEPTSQSSVTSNKKTVAKKRIINAVISITDFLESYSLILISPSGEDNLPHVGNRLIAIAQNNENTLYFRVFDAQGNRVVDLPEEELGETKSDELEALKVLLQPYWDNDALLISTIVKSSIIDAVISITNFQEQKRRDSDRDSYGHWYWIDPTRTQIKVRWANADETEILFPTIPADCPPGPVSAFQPVTTPIEEPAEPLAGLAVTAEGYLVVGSPTTDSLLVFDLYALDGGYVRLPLPQENLEPLDLAALPDGGLLVLDKTRRVWRFDRYLQSVPARSPETAELMLFQPKTGQPHRRVAAPSATAITLSEDITAPIALSVLPDGSFWVLDQPAMGASTLWHYQSDGSDPQHVELVTAQLVEPDADDLDLGLIRANDLAYLPNRDDQGQMLTTGTLFVVDIAGNQAYGLQLVSLDRLDLKIERRYYPIRSFEGVALVPGWDDGEVYYHQNGDRWLPIKALPRQKYETRASLVFSPVQGQAFLDGREPNCLWHRLCVDACLPSETEVRVECRAADQIEHLSLESWQLQPALYKRPSTEIPYSSFWSKTDLSNPDTGTWELLFQDIKGRYLEIRLTLIGNGRSTPLLRSLRVHYPRFSYLREYLPNVYQQDPVSLSFLDRFLANPEGMFTTVEGLIAQVQTLFDVRTVPADAVDWFASWIGLALDPGWSDYQRRLLISQAPYFFQRRGTQIGLLQAILLTIYPGFGDQIFQDNVAELCPTVRIVERFLTRTQPGIAAGDPTDPELTLTGNITADAKARAHRFTVMVPTTLSANTQRLVERIVTLEKPAHTAFILKQYWALFRVGEVRLGLDTVLGQGGQFDTFRLGQSALAEAALGTAFPYSLTNRTVIAH